MPYYYNGKWNSGPPECDEGTRQIIVTPYEHGFSDWPWNIYFRRHKKDWLVEAPDLSGKPHWVKCGRVESSLCEHILKEEE